MDLIYRERKEFIALASTRKVAVYDTGNLESVLSDVKNYVEISNIVCDDFWQWGGEVMGFTKKSPHSLKDNDFVVLITSPYYAYAVEESLVQLGVHDVFCYGFFTEHLNRSFKIGFGTRFMQGKTSLLKGKDSTCMFVALTNRCNCHCPFCSVRYKLNDNDTACNIPLEIYKKLLRDVKGVYVHGRYVDTIGLDGNREFFMYPEFAEALKETKRNGFSSQINTNGVLLTAENARLAMINGVTELKISVCGISPEVYSKHQGYHSGKNAEMFAQKQLNLVIENVRNTIQIRNELGSRTQIAISYLLDDSSREQLKDAVIFWKQVGVDFFWGNPYYPYSEEGEYIGAVEKKLQTLEACFQFFVATNGDLSPCCGAGYCERIIVGNVFDKTFGELIRTEQFNSFYENLASLEENHMNPICIECMSRLA